MMIESAPCRRRNMHAGSFGLEDVMDAARHWHTPGPFHSETDRSCPMHYPAFSCDRW